MFRKPYKVKTSTTMKGSDRRMLRGLIESRYPNLSQESINTLIPNKSEMNQSKAMTHGGRTLMIYYSSSTPVFFLLDDILYPTIYTIWKFIYLLPTVVTVSPVLEKICNGADLMAPGIIIDESSIEEMRNLQVNEVCAIRITGNMVPIAVGIAIMSVNDMCTDGIKGKAVNIVHNFKDTLWASGSAEELPFIAEPQVQEICEETENLSILQEDALDSEQQVAEKDGDNTENDLFVEKDTAENFVDNDSSSVTEVDNNNDIAPSYTMDEILYSSFMTAIKAHGKKIQLPLLTSTFYSSYVLKSCPVELNLDIKKTSYKKLSVFLKKMTKEGLIQIKELTKGVESIVAINLENDLIKSFKFDSLFKSHLSSQKIDKMKEVDTSINVQENYKFPTVLELFVVSAQVKKLFETSNIKYVYG